MKDRTDQEGGIPGRITLGNFTAALRQCEANSPGETRIVLPTQMPRIPLGRDDYFRLLGAFDERARCTHQIKQALGRAYDHRNRLPPRFKKKWAAANAVCAPLVELLRQHERELDSMRESINWESEHGSH